MYRSICGPSTTRAGRCTKHGEGADKISVFPRSSGREDNSEWVSELLNAENGQNQMLGLTGKKVRYFYGIDYQFHALNRLYMPADIARHLRHTAAEL